MPEPTLVNSNQLAAAVLEAGGGTSGTTHDSGLISAATKVTDGVLTNGGNPTVTTLTSATANFQVGDVGKTILINGAGVAGGQFYTTIASRVSATQVTLGTLAPTLVASGAVCVFPTDNEIVNKAIEFDEIKTLRSAKVIGTKNVVETPKRWLKFLMRHYRRFAGAPGANYDSNSGRMLTLGDSIAINISPHLQRRYGYGGKNYKYGNPEISYSAAGVTVLNPVQPVTEGLYQRTPTGIIYELNAALGGELIFNLSGPITGVAVSYLAKNDTGKFKIQHQRNRTGAYVDCVNPWSIQRYDRRILSYTGCPYILVAGNFGAEVGMSVTGTNIPEGTTVLEVSDGVTNVTKTVTKSVGSAVLTMDSVEGIAPGMTVSGGGLGGYVVGINTVANTVTLNSAVGSGNGGVSDVVFSGFSVKLSAAPTGSASLVTFAANDAGVNDGVAGVLDTNNGSATEKFCTASVSKVGTDSQPDYHRIKIVATSGIVRIITLHADCGGLGLCHPLYRKQGWFDCAYSLGGRRVVEDFSVTPLSVWKRALAWLDPDFIAFRSLNDWSLNKQDFKEKFAEFIGNLQAAAPEATIIVGGAHNTGGVPERDSGYALTDDWVREWCADNDTLFVDIISNMPEYSNTWGALESVWSDGLHLGDVSNFLGYGSHYLSALMYRAIADILDYTCANSTLPIALNASRPIPGTPNKIRMYGETGGLEPVDRIFAFEGPPRTSLSVVAGHMGCEVNLSGGSGMNAGYRAGFQSIYYEGNQTGSALGLLSQGYSVLTFGHQGIYFLGFIVGANGSNIGTGTGSDGTANILNMNARACDGYRFLLPGNAGMVIEGRSTMSATGRALGIDIGASDSTAGTALWTWNTGATVADYLVNGAKVIGDTVITVDTGTAQIPVGAIVRFGTDANYYRVTAGVTGAGNITIAPALVANIADNTAMTVLVRPQVIFHGRVNDGHTTTYTHDEPIAAQTIHTPVCATAGTGAIATRMIGVVPSYATKAAGEAAVGVGEVFWSEADRKVFTRLA